ncbi:MAG: MFS transporter [Candidatus Kariarchaeaceae archaeon]|jgi:DHA1 family multidrug resistance protein-like MFS transporter
MKDQSQTPKLSTASFQMLFFAVFIDLFGFGIIIPILPVLAVDKFGASGFEYGLILAFYSLMQFLFAPFWGSLSDRRGRRPIILIGLGGSSIGFALFAFATNLYMIYLARIVAGIFTSATLTVANAYIADTTSPKERGAAYGKITAAFGLGFAIGPGVGGLLADSNLFGLSGQMITGLFSAGLALINLIGAIFTIPESLTVENLALKSAESTKFKFMDISELRRVSATKGIPLYMALFSLISLGFSLLIASFPVYAQGKDSSVHEKELGYYFTYAGVVLLITQYLLIKPLINRFGEQNLIKLGILCMFTGFLIFPYAPSFLWMALANTPTLFGLAIANPSINSSLSKIANRKDQGTVMGFNQSFSSFMRIIGPLTGGLLLDLDFAYPFYLGAVIFILTFLFVASRLEPPLETERLSSYVPEPMGYDE